MKITKEQVLSNLEDVKKYIQEAEEEKVLGIAIKNRLGEIIFQSTKTTYKEAIKEKGDLDLSGADLSDAELNCAKFYGKGGSIVIKKKDLDGFLGALGFKLED